MAVDKNLNPEVSPFKRPLSDIPVLPCGIVMPIAAMGDYSESHWLDVQNIIKEAVSFAGYEARLVSESADATVIIRSIVQNVYQDEIVVCDVSGMNPNVMFELGMRLAFDKPVVIIKDEVTRFSFDISTIEHLEYPKSLRYQSIQQFKVKLADKIRATSKASQEDGYRSFLSNFGSFTVANLKDTTLNESEALERILGKLDKFDNRLLHLESVKDNDNLLLSHLNRTSPKPYRTLLKRVIDQNSFSSKKFDILSQTLDSLYGNNIRLTLSQNEGNISLTVFTNMPPTYESQTIERISQVINKTLDDVTE